MTLALIEGAVDAVYDYIQPLVADKWDELNTRYDDTVTLTDIKKWYLGEMPQEFPELPSIAICGLDVTPEQQELGRIRAGNRLDIVIMVGEPDLEKRFRMLSRYAIGILELLEAGANAVEFRYQLAGKIVFSDTLSTPDWLKAVSIPINIRAFEVFATS